MKCYKAIVILVLFLFACSTQTPTATPSKKTTPTRSSTNTPKATLTDRPVTLDACVTDSTIRVREGGSTEYNVIGGLVSGSCVTILGRNEDSTWVYIMSEDNTTTGWVAEWLLTIDGDIKQVPIQFDSQITDLVPLASPTKKIAFTNTPKPVLTNTPRPVFTPTQSTILCSQTDTRIGQFLSCKIERAYCDYLPATDGSPTFCNDRPYPNQNFALVVFGENWSNYDGSCIIVTGQVSSYRGVPQIIATSRIQVSYC